MNIREANKALAESVSLLSEESNLKWGFDLTDFGSVSNFKKVIEPFNMKFKRVTKKSKNGDTNYEYKWSAPGIMIVTFNNPITGEYGVPDGREAEKGYASYVGIEGDPDKVKKMVKLIKKHSTDFKDESPKSRDFI